VQVVYGSEVGSFGFVVYVYALIDCCNSHRER
jgi:hypothetical protein